LNTLLALLIDERDLYELKLSGARFTKLKDRTVYTEPKSNTK